MTDDFAAATPRPWYVSGIRTKTHGEPVLQIVGADEKCNTLVLYGDGSAKDHIAAHADARLIVAAVNAYHEPSDEDVERVARAIAKSIESSPHNFGDTGYRRTMEDAARAAIAALRAKP